MEVDHAVGTSNHIADQRRRELVSEETTPVTGERASEYPKVRVLSGRVLQRRGLAAGTSTT